MLKTVTLSNGQRLVQVQNPWGSEKFHGNWSDKDWHWNDTFRAEAGWKERDDGTFFMSLEDYYDQMSETYFNYNVDKWYSDTYLYKDDTGYSPGKYSWCGSQCTRRELTLKSDV